MHCLSSLSLVNGYLSIEDGIATLNMTMTEMRNPETGGHHRTQVGAHSLDSITHQEKVFLPLKA